MHLARPVVGWLAVALLGPVLMQYLIQNALAELFLGDEIKCFFLLKKMHSTLFKSGDNPKFMQNTELQI